MINAEDHSEIIEKLIRERRGELPTIEDIEKQFCPENVEEK